MRCTSNQFCITAHTCTCTCLLLVTSNKILIILAAVPSQDSIHTCKPHGSLSGHCNYYVECTQCFPRDKRKGGNLACAQSVKLYLGANVHPSFKI